MNKKASEVVSCENPKNRERVLTDLATWIQKFVRSESLYDFDRRVREIAVILLSKYLTKSVTKRLERLEMATVIGTWNSFEMFENLFSLRSSNNFIFYRSSKKTMEKICSPTCASTSSVLV